MVLITLIYYVNDSERRMLLSEKPKGVKQLRKSCFQKLGLKSELEYEYILLYKDLKIELDTENLCLTEFYRGVDTIEIYVIETARKDSLQKEKEWIFIKSSLINFNISNVLDLPASVILDHTKNAFKNSSKLVSENKKSPSSPSPNPKSLPAENKANQKPGSKKQKTNNKKDFELNSGTAMFEDIDNETDLRINRNIDEILGDDLEDDADSFSEKNYSSMNKMQLTQLLSNEKTTSSKKMSNLKRKIMKKTMAFWRK